MRRARPGWTILCALLLRDGGSGAGHAAATTDDTELRFVRDGQVVNRLDLATLKQGCRAETIDLDDPYYGRRKSFLAFRLRGVLTLGFGLPPEELARLEFLLRARDGYVKPATGQRLTEEGGFLAFADAARSSRSSPGWEPIDRRQVDPGPYYVVWAGPQQRDTHRYPWPYQLVSIEIAAIAREYPHTVPASAAPESAAWAGFATFKNECISCHSINGEGGKIGPDLNVPRSIVEYRPIEQVKQYIRDPAIFRYTSMPAHAHLTDRQLDEIVAYFETMKTLKYDPGGAR